MKIFVIIPVTKAVEHLIAKTDVPNTAFNLKSSYYTDEGEAILEAERRVKLYHRPQLVLKSHILLSPIPTEVNIKQTKY